MAPDSNGHARYVYGVVPAGSSPPDQEGIGGRPLEVVKSGGLGALTSEVPDSPLEAGRDELMAHSRVLEGALDSTQAVLPMRFGVVMPSDAAVRDELLDAHRPDLEDQLKEMAGRVEMNLKGMFDERAILREVVAESKEVAALRDAISGAHPDATYPERIRLGELVAEALSAKREAAEREVLDRLGPLALGVQIGNSVHERMAVNAAFLLDRGDTAAFDDELERLAEENHPRIAFKLTGPLPPHSFVELAVEA